MIKVFCVIPPDDEKDYWATDVLDLEENIRSEIARRFSKIEQYQWGIKQVCGIEYCQARSATSQRAHILMVKEHFCDLR
jgi:putative transposase